MDNVKTNKKISKKKEKEVKVKPDKFGEDYEFSPVRQVVTPSTLAGGIVIRCATIALMIFGYTVFLNDCFSLGVGLFTLIFSALAASAIFGLLLFGGKTSLIGLGALGGTVLIWVLMYPTFFHYLSSCIDCTLNSAGTVLVDAGYTNMSVLLRRYSSYGEAGSMNAGTMFLFSLVSAFILTLCNMKRTLLIPTVILTLAVFMPGITYNLASSNWGFAFILTALFAMIVMRFFDFAYKAKKEDKVNRASLGGYTGGAAALIALLCILVPSITVKGTWKDIEAISKPMSIARDIVTSVISGDMPNLKEMGVIRNMDEQNSRNVAPKTIKYTGESVLTVTSHYKDTPNIYLRGWVAAGKFDGTSWSSPTNDMIRIFDTYVSDLSVSAGYTEHYSPDAMTDAFYDLLGDSYSFMDDAVGYSDHLNDGYAALRLDIKMNLGVGTGNLLFLPSTTDASVGLNRYDSTRPYRGKQTRFYDGMTLTGWLNMNKSYSVKAYATNLSVSTAHDNFTDMLNFVRAASDFIEICHKNPNMSDSAKELQLIIATESYGVSYMVEAREQFYREYNSWNDEKKTQMYNRYVLLAKKYTEYVNLTYCYGALSNISAIKNIASALRVSYNTPTHEKVLKAVQFLVSNYTFTTEPAKGTAKNLTPFESFLTETREGSSVQYATALTLILRELGVPARYVEGYIATNFESNGEKGGYSDELTDRNAHAWVEVYYPGYGWMTYEATPRYARPYYGNAIKLNSGSVDNGESQPVIPDTPAEGGEGVYDPLYPDTLIPGGPITNPQKEFPWAKVTRACIGAAIVLLAIIIAVKYIKHKANQAVYARKRLVEKAIYGVPEAEYRELSHEINETLFSVMDTVGYSPKSGELPSEYASRLDADFIYVTGTPFSKILGLIQKQEFGKETSAAELKTVAEYLDELLRDTYRSMSRPQRFWHRYVRRAI